MSRYPLMNCKEGEKTIELEIFVVRIRWERDKSQPDYCDKYLEMYKVYEHC